MSLLARKILPLILSNIGTAVLVGYIRSGGFGTNCHIFIDDNPVRYGAFKKMNFGVFECILYNSTIGTEHKHKQTIISIRPTIIMSSSDMDEQL